MKTLIGNNENMFVASWRGFVWTHITSYAGVYIMRGLTYKGHSLFCLCVTSLGDAVIAIGPFKYDRKGNEA